MGHVRTRCAGFVCACAQRVALAAVVCGSCPHTGSTSAGLLGIWRATQQHSALGSPRSRHWWTQRVGCETGGCSARAFDLACRVTQTARSAPALRVGGSNALAQRACPQQRQWLHHEQRRTRRARPSRAAAGVGEPARAPCRRGAQPADVGGWRAGAGHGASVTGIQDQVGTPDNTHTRMGDCVLPTGGSQWP